MMLIRLFLLSLALASSGLAWAQSRGEVISYRYLRSYTKQNVQDLLNRFGIPSLLIRPEFEVDVYRVVYHTANAQNNGLTQASGALVVPKGVSCPMPLLSYQHGTTSERYEVPSYLSAEIQLGMLFCSGGGYVVTMPDYLGMGDSPGFHPYVHAKSQATATVDLLRAARQLKDSIGYDLNNQLFLFGYSQGGHATMAAFRELEQLHSTEFTVTACAPMSGPYDISGVQAQTITADAPYSTPGYLPYVVLGYQTVYTNLYTNLSDIFRSPYDTLLPQLFDGTNSIGYINSFLPDTPKHMLNPVFYNDFVNNPNNPGRLALRDNDVYNWAPQAPLQLLYCMGDEQVFYMNSVVTYDTMVARRATNVTKFDFGNYDHGDCLPYCMLNGYNFFATYKNNSGGMQPGFQVQGVTAQGQNNGEIRVNPTGGLAPYQFVWQDTQDTGSVRSGLAQGGYVVRISDARGCFFYRNASVGLSSSVAEMAEPSPFLLAPNPAQDRAFVRVDAAVETDLVLYNDLGQELQRLSNVQPNSIKVFYLNQYPHGLYTVVMLHQGRVLEQKRLVVGP
jgi:pimeloyl-ACP methyl ester carboxylesterase